MCADALAALGHLRQQGETLYLIPQNLIEFWRTCTRPIDRNGFGMNAFQAEAELTRLEHIFPILPDVPEIYAEWRRLVITYKVMGIQVHDAHLVAAMEVHGILHVLTFNVQDFQRYTNITVVHPREIAR